MWRWKHISFRELGNINKRRKSKNSAQTNKCCRISQSEITLFYFFLISNSGDEKKSIKFLAMILLKNPLPIFFLHFFPFFFFFRIEIPGEKPQLLSEEWENGGGLKYYGEGLAKGQCGASIQQVKSYNHGKAKCFMGVKGEELQGELDLTVACKILPKFFNCFIFFIWMVSVS